MRKIIAPKTKSKKEQTFCTLCDTIDLKAHKSAMLGHIPCLELSFKQKPKLFKLTDANGATPIHLAARENQIRAFRWILTNTELTIYERARNGETPSHVAAAQGNLDMLKLVVNYDLNHRLEVATLYDNLGFTPLKLAILRDHPVILEWLLEEFGSAAFGDPSKSEESDVHICAALGHLACLKVLLKHSPSLATLSVDDGTTPVYYASQEGRLNILEHLVGMLGCSPAGRANDGMTPLHAAAQNGHTRVVKYLVEAMGREAILGQTGDGATPIHFAASKGHVDTLKWLLDHDTSGTGVKVTDEMGGTPAHDAADNGELECLTFLVERGADIFAEDLNKATPYLLGLESGNDDVKSYLRKLAISLGKLPVSRAISAKGSRRGSVSLDSREEPEVSGVATPRETDEVKTARVSFDAMKYATQVGERVDRKDSLKDSESESEGQPESPAGILPTLQEVPSKESVESDKRSLSSAHEGVKEEVSASRSARRSAGGGDLQRTPSLYTSQDLSGDDFFDLEKLEKDIDDLNKQFNEMQFDWQNTISSSLDPPPDTDAPSRRESRHILKSVIPQFAPIHSPPSVRKEIKPTQETQIQEIQIEFSDPTGPATSRREQSRNLKKKLGEGIPGIANYLDDTNNLSDNDTVTPQDSDDSNHSSQVDLHEHPLLPISEEISPYELGKREKVSEQFVVTQRTSFVGEISHAEVHLERELTEEQLRERSGKGKFVIFSDTVLPKERRPISTGQTLEGFDVGQLSDEDIMGLYARMDPSKKRQVLQALIHEAREADDTEDLAKENEIVQELKAKVVSTKVATVHATASLTN